MNYYAWTALVNTLVALACAAFTFFQNTESRRNQILTIHWMTLALWQSLYCAWQLADNPETALYLLRAVIFAAIPLPTFHYKYCLTLFNLYTPFRRRLLHWMYGATIFLMALAFSPWMVKGIEPRGGLPYWGIPGPLFHLHVLLFLIPIVFTLYLLWEYRTKASPLAKNLLTLLLAAIGFGYGGGGTNWPLWYNIPIPPVLNFMVGFYIATSTLVYFQLGLFDIHLFFRDAAIHAATTLVVAVTVGVVALLIIPVPLAMVTAVISAALVPHIYRPLSGRIRRIINKTGLGRFNLYLEKVDATVEKIKESTYTYDDLAHNIVQSVLTTFPVETAAVYLFDLNRKEFRLRAQAGMKNPLARNLGLNRTRLAVSDSDPLLALIGSKKNLIVLDALLGEPEQNDLKISAIDSMRRIEAEVCAPFLFAGQVKGFLILSRKRDNQIFNKEDFDAIHAFARMGEEVMRYIMGMETELKHSALYSHDMDNDTKSLAQTLQFLQTPMAKSQNPERIQSLIKQAEDVASRLNQSFRMNRERSDLIMRTIRGEYERTKVDLTQMLRLSTGKFTLLAEKAAVELITDIPKGPYFISGNSNDLIRVFDNLLANALRYVPEGGKIEVFAEEKGDFLVVTVRDNGKGIELPDIERIWEMGWQVKDARQGASGFGLSIAKQIITLNLGTIAVQSEGADKGTTFTIKLPLLREIPAPSVLPPTG